MRINLDKFSERPFLARRSDRGTFTNSQSCGPTRHLCELIIARKYAVGLSLYGSPGCYSPSYSSLLHRRTSHQANSIFRILSHHLSPELQQHMAHDLTHLTLIHGKLHPCLRQPLLVVHLLRPEVTTRAPDASASLARPPIQQ
jgi:hypothetical protein